jgi:cytochrome d ubiquinol oxidase subunit II
VTLDEVPLLLMLVGLAAYAVLGGADFGAAFWQLSARGEHGGALRQHAYRAMGPVWEANHVWLVFVLVICWTAYPEAFASIFSTLSVPLFAAAIGIILRGTAYAVHAGTAREIERRTIDGLFSISSLLTPFALGAAVGAIASGRVPVGNAAGDPLTSWLNPTSLLVGTLAVAAGAYVAAVYLAGDAARAGLSELAAAFRTRALGAGFVTGAIAFAGLAVVAYDTERFSDNLFAWPALATIAASAAAGIATLELVRRWRFEAARYGASAAVASVVAGWALAQRPELLSGLTAEEAAAGRRVLIATIVGVALGAVILIPSLALLFGLVLHGRFDERAAERLSERATLPPRRPRLPLMVIATVAGAVGLPLMLVFDDGPFLGFGVIGLLTFVALASVALIRSSAGGHPAANSVVDERRGSGAGPSGSGNSEPAPD